ncbi:MAG TPA: AMP-binding protein [Candidatus Rifleibacterium sp.]|nr:AMP-binding protein [Candidatus Rifleibacterium sp.]HPT46198.1 AMP-binding protein [Candidatus Rifleibacterium sp.]
MFGDTLKITLTSEFASKDAIISDDAHGKCDRLTYQQLTDEVATIAGMIREAGIAAGERVIFVSENHLYWLPIFLGITNAGAIAVPIDGNCAVERFHAVVTDCRPAGVIISRKFEKRFAEFMLSGCEVRATINLYFDLFVFSNVSETAVAAIEPKADDTAAIIYTSGTTGKPKGIMLSHRAIVESIKLGLVISGYKTEERMLALLPFTHVFALIDSGLVMLGCHSSLVVCNSFNPGEIMQVLMKHRATYVLAVPRLAELMAMGLMQAPDIKLPGLTMIIGGASPRPEVMQLLIARGIKTFQGFGMTETAAGVLIGHDCPIESVGRPQCGVSVRINEPVNGIGELLIASPTLFSGVFGQPGRDETMFIDGFFKTGDLAQMDAGGNVYIKGRAKEVIISASGLNVYPDELELRLGALPYAEEYVIFGYCAEGLELPALALQRRNEFFKDRSVGKVRDFVEEDIRQRTVNWPTAEKIRKIFIVDQPLPRSASAKIKRFEVAAMFCSEAAPVKAQPEERGNVQLDAKLFEMFRSEVAAFLNVEPGKINLSTRLDEFMMLDSLGVIALMIRLEKRFTISFRELLGSSVTTFSEVFSYLAKRVDGEKRELVQSSEAPGGSLPPLLDFSEAAVERRQQFIRDLTGNSEFRLPVAPAVDDYAGNIEGLVGFAMLPVGICGPLKVVGQKAVGDFYLPLATTEGALVSSVARGCQVITLSGGAEVRLVNDSVVRTPVFVLDSLAEQEKFSHWIENNFSRIKQEAEKTTRHGKLKEIELFPIGCQLILRFSFSTGDASGQNMTTIATRGAVDYILKYYNGRIDDWFLESNLSGDKKINSINFTGNRGKKMVAACTIPASLVKQVLHTTPERMCRLADLSMVTSIQSHSFGVQAHYANTLAAVYIATGQDPACVAESAAGITYLQMRDGNLHISVTLPGIMVGTVGGGTRLPTQKSCLDLMQCAGSGNSQKFAEILAVGVLAGEISIIGAMAADEFTDAHARYGRAGGLSTGAKS